MHGKTELPVVVRGNRIPGAPQGGPASVAFFFAGPRHAWAEKIPIPIRLSVERQMHISPHRDLYRRNGRQSELVNLTAHKDFGSYAWRLSVKGRSADRLPC